MGEGVTEIECRVREMFDALTGAPREVLPSKYWEVLNRTNIAQLADYGYENFKRTLARNYFTWTVSPFDVQIRYLCRRLSLGAVLKIATRTLFSAPHPPLNWAPSLSYTFLTRLLWEYTGGESAQLLERLEEPLEGNPPLLFRKGKLISQDLANAVLEYRSIMAPEIDRAEIRTILELGPGYGRTAFVFLSLMPEARYILVDLPPALAVAEKYLSIVFPNHRIFRFRPFHSFEEVREEFDGAQIAFLLPHQLEMLPDKCTELFVNISSLHEMRPDQIEYYFHLIRRLVRKYCYLKQWKESRIPYENIIIRESDYPIPAEWKRIYWRVCAVQEHFFEALLELPARAESCGHSSL